MATNFIQEGKTLDFTPQSADVVSGQVITMGTIGGIAKTDIKQGKTGAVHICGVFSVAKATGAITQGQKLYWNSSNSNLTTTATGNTLLGVAAAPAVSADATAKLLLNVGL
jgi:predicted RecA/RadA family phage recombinase